MKPEKISTISVLFLYIISIILLISIFTTSYTSAIAVSLFDGIIAYILFLVLGTLSFFNQKKPAMSKRLFIALSVILGIFVAYILFIIWVIYLI
jgi:hypothetical protein